MPAFAGEPSYKGWAVDFTINCSSGKVTVGGNDYAYGFHILPITGSVNASLEGGFGAQIHYGSTAPFTETMSITPIPSAPSQFILSWKTYNWQPVYFYQEGDLWPQFSVYGEIDQGSTTIWLDLTKAGSISIPSDKPYTLDIFANPVPEPGNIVTLLTGFIGLAGATWRRKR
jgi:hypothetical protein